MTTTARDVQRWERIAREVNAARERTETVLSSSSSSERTTRALESRWERIADDIESSITRGPAAARTRSSSPPRSSSGPSRATTKGTLRPDSPRRSSSSSIAPVARSVSPSGPSPARSFRLPRVRGSKAPVPLLVGLGLGLGLIVLFARRSSSSPASSLPSVPPSTPPAPPSTPPAAPPATPPSTPPAPPPPPSTPPPAAAGEPDWQTAGNGLVILNRLPGFHRSTAAERRKDPDVVANAGAFLKHDVRTVHVVTAKSGRRWAYAVEEHNNHPNTIGPKNKGVSLFVEDGAT